MELFYRYFWVLTLQEKEGYCSNTEMLWDFTAEWTHAKWKTKPRGWAMILLMFDYLMKHIWWGFSHSADAHRLKCRMQHRIDHKYQSNTQESLLISIRLFFLQDLIWSYSSLKDCYMHTKPSRFSKTWTITVFQLVINPVMHHAHSSCSWEEKEVEIAERTAAGKWH